MSKDKFDISKHQWSDKRVKLHFTTNGLSLQTDEIYDDDTANFEISKADSDAIAKHFEDNKE